MQSQKLGRLRPPTNIESMLAIICHASNDSKTGPRDKKFMLKIFEICYISILVLYTFPVIKFTDFNTGFWSSQKTYKVFVRPWRGEGA